MIRQTRYSTAQLIVIRQALLENMWTWQKDERSEHMWRSGYAWLRMPVGGCSFKGHSTCGLCMLSTSSTECSVYTVYQNNTWSPRGDNAYFCRARIGDSRRDVLIPKKGENVGYQEKKVKVKESLSNWAEDHTHIIMYGISYVAASGGEWVSPQKSLQLGCYKTCRPAEQRISRHLGNCARWDPNLICPH